jgi:head-tail adaptor
MRSGTLKYKLTLLEPQRTTDRMGSERTQYVETRTVWAERVIFYCQPSEEVGEHFPRIKHTVHIERTPDRREQASKAATGYV